MISEARALAHTLPPLLLAARHVAGGAAGSHGRRRAGPGETFWQFRTALPGDSSARIDWRQSARGDTLQVRETEWTAPADIHLWCDASASMDWASSPAVPRKAERAEVLTLALSILLLRAGERVTALGSPQRPVTSEGGLERLARDLVALGDTLPTGSRKRSSRGRTAVLVSDFLAPIDSWSHAIRSLAAQGFTGHLVQLADPAESTLPYGGRIRFKGLENEAPVLINRVQDVRDDYKRRFKAHQTALSQLAGALGWSHMIHVTAQTPQTPLLALCARLSERFR